MVEAIVCYTGPFFKFLDDDEAGQEEKSFVRCHGDTLGRPRLPAAAAGCYVLMV